MATQSKIEEHQKELKEAEGKAWGWFDAFQDISDFMLERDLWAEDDIDKENPGQTLINGLTRFLEGASNLHAKLEDNENKSEERMIELAEAQLTGYLSAKHGESLEDLVSSMGLTLVEWNVIKEKLYLSLSNDDIDCVDRYFESL